MHYRTTIIFLACVFAGITALFFLGAFTDSVNAPVTPEKKNSAADAMFASTADNKQVFEVAAPAIDYAKILARFKGKDVEMAPVSEKLIALTFDGGGNAESAEDIIKILSSNGVHATFFLTGNFIGKFPDIVKRIVSGGNEIANHTATHKNFSKISNEEAAAEMKSMERAATDLGMNVVPFFRFPYGAPTKEKIALVNERGYVAVRWTVDSLGWQGAKDGRDASFVVARVTEKAIQGAIVLMHLGSASDGSALDADALERIITTLAQQGYRFVSLSELFTASL